jgi:hypothetical protein
VIQAQGEKIIQVDRHMRPVKVAKTDVYDAGGKSAAVIGGT